MSMTEQKGLVPRLRFPEFAGDGDWVERTLGDAAEYQQPTPFLVSDTNYDDSFLTPVLTAGKTFILGYTNESEGIYSGPFPVILFDDFTTDSKLVDFPFKVKSSAAKIILAGARFDTRFLFALLQVYPYEVAAHERHWISKFAPRVLPFPSPEEQTRISDCLSSLDSLITAESRQLDALKEHKKGLLQQLFPQEGERVPRVRFPEFAGDGSWYFSSLSSLANITQGGTPKTEVEEYWGGPVAWLTPAEMGKNIDPHISLTKRTITEAGLRSCTSDLLPPYSVILSTRAPIGHLAINTVPMAINQGCRGIVPKGNSEYRFLYHSLIHLNDELQRLGAGNTFKELSGSTLKAFQIPCTSIEEQTHIADCLSSLDDLVSAQYRKVETLKTFKQGLMQQMFPNDRS